MARDFGKVRMAVMGSYDADTEYEPMDIVTMNGSTYCAKKGGSGRSPSDTEYWFMAAQGAYQAAVEAGYKGTEEQWKQEISGALVVANAAKSAADGAVRDASAAKADAAKAVTDAASAKSEAAGTHADAQAAREAAESVEGKVALAEASATAAEASATKAAEHLAALEEAIKELPDGQAVSEKVAEHTVAIAEQDGKLAELEGRIAVEQKEEKRITTSSTTANNPTGIVLHKGITYTIKAKCATATVDGDARSGLYVKKDDSSTIQILQVRDLNDWKNGLELEYTPDADCELLVRTLTVDNEVSVSASWKAGVKEFVAQNSADILQLNKAMTMRLEYSLTTTKTTVNFIEGFVTEANKQYTITAKTKNRIQSSNGGAFYTMNGSSPFAQFTSDELFNGVTFDYTPTVSDKIGVRTWEVGTEFEIVIALSGDFKLINDEIKKLETYVDESIGQYKPLNWEVNRYGTISKTWINHSSTASGQTLMRFKLNGEKFIKVGVATNSENNMAVGFTVGENDNIMVTSPTPFTKVNEVEEIVVEVPASAKYAWIYNRQAINSSPKIFALYQSVESDISGIKEGVKMLSPWNDKNVVVWGDSITAQGNGDNGECYNSYMFYAYNKLGFKNLFVRAIGGQTYMWNTKGYYSEVGSTGKYLDRYKYTASGVKTSETVNPSTITDIEKGYIENALGKTIEIHYGSFCSWDRITHMIPDTMRNDIDLIILNGGHNDFSAVEDASVTGSIKREEPKWIPNNKTDVTWGNSSIYNGGDYDINTLSGAIASCAMKMRLWCPNAVIVLATPFARFDVDKQLLKITKDGVTLNFRDLCDFEIYAAQCVGMPQIDANSACGIDGTTFQDFVLDGVHPNEEGRKKYGRVFANMLNGLSHKIL